ncbi:MAG: polysaccharide deacetylase family protein [Firmicutes bacterium]|nr:polysaccharide deacetylase family protein [Bacillota bacterium]
MFLVFKLKRVLLIATSVLIAALLVFSFYKMDARYVFMGSDIREVPINAVKTDEKKLSVSFDTEMDGTAITEATLKELERNNAKATFFVLGSWAQKYPELTKRIFDLGHEIATHSNTHPNFTKLNNTRIRLELETSVRILQDITGATIKYFRPPFGAYNQATLKIAKELGLTTVLWNVDSKDHQNVPAGRMSQNVLKNANCGSILLFHNFGKGHIDGLAIILERLSFSGYNIVPIGQLLYTENYKVNKVGVQYLNK